MELATRSEVVTPSTRLNRCRKALFATAASAVLSLTCVTAAHAAPIVITFDEGPSTIEAGDTLANQYADLGVTFSPNAFSGPGAPTGNWATNTHMTIVSSASPDAPGLGEPPLVSGNVLRSFSGWFSENGDASFRVAFDTPISFFGATFASVNPLYSDAVNIYAFSGNTPLGTATGAAIEGQQVLTFSSLIPITSVIITPGSFNDYVAVDNITFDPIAVVPEPASMVLVGAGLAGVIARRRRR